MNRNSTPDLVLQCPHCHKMVDAHENPDPNVHPEDGNVDICFHCGGVSFYYNDGTSLTLRIPTDVEQAELDNDEDVITARKAISIASTPRLAIHLYGMMTGQISD